MAKIPPKRMKAKSREPVATPEPGVLKNFAEVIMQIFQGTGETESPIGKIVQQLKQLADQGDKKAKRMLVKLKAKYPKLVK